MGVRPIYQLRVRITDLPGNRTGRAIVPGEQLQVKNIDRPIVVQICCSRRGQVVAHPDRQRIELVDHLVVIDIAGEESDRWHTAGSARRDCGHSLGTKETAGCGADAVGPTGSREAERPIQVGSRGGDQCVACIIKTYGYWFAGQDLARERPVGQRRRCR